MAIFQRATTRAILALVFLCVVSACGTRPAPGTSVPPPFQLKAPTPTPKPPDEPVRVLGHFTGAQAEPQLRSVLERFSEATGTPVLYESAENVPELLLERLEAGEVPDVILLPVPNWLDELAGAGAIPPLSSEAASAVETHFGEAWVDLVSHDDVIYGVPLDANLKSLLWYRPAAFKAVDSAPPQSLDELYQLAAALSEEGQRAFAVTGGAGWTLTDWFESVLLASAGPHVYDDLVQHRIAWTDHRVEEAALRFVSLLRSEWLMEGAEGAAELPLWPETFQATFDPSTPGAAMWLGQSSITSDYAATSGLKAGEDYDLMPFPAQGAVVGVGSVAVATNDAPTTMNLLAFLAQPGTFESWIRQGGFISPNRNVPIESYPTSVAQQEAILIVDATLFRYDLSDQLPHNLKLSYLPDRLREMLVQPDRVHQILAEIEEVATREQGTPVVR